MTGPAVVDDYTFTIKTTEKVSNLPVRLGYSAFSPLPDSFFKDPEAFGEKPIGAGPYQVESWTKNQSVVLKKFADYSGKFGGNLDTITFKIYQDSDAAYNDVIANQLDITDEIPTSAMIDDKYKSDLPDRNAQKETGVIQTVTFAPPAVDPAYKDPKVRQAISMAINREEIIKQIFNNTRVPATGWVSPVVDGYKADQCGEYCTFDAAKAKAQLEAAGGFSTPPITCPTTLTRRTRTGPRQPATRSRTPSVSTASGRCRGLQDLPWPDPWSRDEGHVPHRLADGLPVDRELPRPIFKTGASSNDGDYSNPAFDKKLGGRCGDRLR